MKAAFDLRPGRGLRGRRNPAGPLVGDARPLDAQHRCFWWSGRTRQKPVVVIDSDRPVHAHLDLHPGLGVAGALAVGQQLEAVGPLLDRIVGRDGSLVLEAEELLQPERGGQRPVGGAGDGRGDGEAAVVAGQEGGEHGVSFCQGAGVGQTQLAYEPVLEGAPEPLDAPFGLGAPGGDRPDAELLEQSAELGGSDLAGELLGDGEAIAMGSFGAQEGPMPVMVEGEGEARGAHNLFQD